jgi:hypothetical protein
MNEEAQQRLLPNVLPFSRPEEIDLEFDLDEKTVQKLEEMASKRGLSLDLLLREFLDIYLADFEIGESLILHLQTLKISAGKPTREAIKHWEERIEFRLDNLGVNESAPALP